ncbi:MAG: ATP-binding cassette domain-containing protein [Acidobacteriota bacterium]|nr:ATP-binding cassette domain-containing protein [Acidobacteriota bacterium]MDH3523227.1 ATP-binding cassette domain-containing protein [Acidobacteriota bacterium]
MSGRGAIQFLRVTKRFAGGQVALDEVSFVVEAGEFVFLTGDSGAGKTTLLSLIYRAALPTSGSVLVNGRNVGSLPPKKVPYLRRSIGVVFQDSRLIRRKTVFENVGYLPRILGLSAARQRELAMNALAQVGLEARAGAFPAQLSGGEQQRVAIARALANDPPIILADEPTGNLDPELSRQIFKLFVEARQRGTTVLVATHDPNAIRSLPARVLRLKAGQLTEDSARRDPASAIEGGVRS